MCVYILFCKSIHFVVIQSTKQDVDVFHIPFENDNAMLKGVELLLEKGKVNEFTSVVISK